MSMLCLRVACIVLILALAAGSCWAESRSGLWDSLVSLSHEPWGVMTFSDLASGFLVAIAWMAWREPRRALIPLWIVGVILLGNMVTLLFVLRCSIGAGDLAAVIGGPRIRR